MTASKFPIIKSKDSLKISYTVDRHRPSVQALTIPIVAAILLFLDAFVVFHAFMKINLSNASVLIIMVLVGIQWNFIVGISYI